MNLLLRIDNNVVAIVVSVIFLMNILRRLDQKDRKNRVFTIMFILNTLELVIETVTCIINRQPYMWIIPVTTILHMILYILAPIITYIWYVFADVWINEEKEHKWQNNILSKLPIIINTILVLINPFLKLLFYISEHNVYQRGIAYFIPVSISYFYLLYSLIFIYINREKVNKVDFLPLMLFGLFPAICGLIQSLFYGFLLIWSSIAFSMIILYIYLQNQMMQTDRLTGAWTCEKLYTHLKNRIERNKVKNFSIVFIDLDDFKKINDAFGHNEGDKALIAIVKIIKSILSNGNFIARYGGDEFILFLNVENKQNVEAIMKRINNAFNNYNNSSNNLYKLNYSYGYDLYDFHRHMTADEYINHVDQLMYQTKKNKKLKNI